jgi:hypothetical protein
MKDTLDVRVWLCDRVPFPGLPNLLLFPAHLITVRFSELVSEYSLSRILFIQGYPLNVAKVI